MAKIKTDPITQTDLISFLDDFCDFGFEIKVVNVLAAHSFDCEHGGTYFDPATQKPRQFDIRATARFDQYIIRLAVECKNLRRNFPLLVSCIPRTSGESFHDIAVSVDSSRVSLLPESAKHGIYCQAMEPAAKTVRLRDTDCIYKQSQFVGKASDQVGLDSNDNIVANDSDVYGKWAQAIASAQDLADRACYDGRRGEYPAYFSFILPVLVVPDGTLWVTHFDDGGNRVLEPENRDRCPLYINKSYCAGDRLEGTEYCVSHLEFVTISGLHALIAELTSNDLEELFPRARISARIAEYLRSGDDTNEAI